MKINLEISGMCFDDESKLTEIITNYILVVEKLTKRDWPDNYSDYGLDCADSDVWHLALHGVILSGRKGFI